jgi:hypothetical protein
MGYLKEKVSKLSPFFIPQNKEVSNKTTTFALYLKY